MKQADAGLILPASPLLRATLIEAGHRLIRWDPRWREMASKLVAREKPINAVVAAVANLWIRWFYH